MINRNTKQSWLWKRIQLNSSPRHLHFQMHNAQTNVSDGEGLTPLVLCTVDQMFSWCNSP